MGILSLGLLNVYRSRVLNPVIIEFTDSAAIDTRLPALKKLVDVTQLTSVGSPMAWVGTLTSPIDRVRSRFQNTIIALKIMKRFSMVAMPLDPDSVDTVVDYPEVVKVYPDLLHYTVSVVPPTSVHQSPLGRTYTTLADTKKLIGADEAKTDGYAGKGTSVAVLDTGGSPIHAMTRGMEYHTTMAEKGQFKDTNGHGEWVCSCVGGVHALDRTLNVELEGMAPQTSLVSIKCLGFVLGIGFQSDIIQAIDLAITKKVDVINMSLGADQMPATPDDDPEIKALNTAVDADIIPVIACGNAGPKVGSVGTPGCADSVVTVGAYDPIKGTMPDTYSSRGPTLWSTIKPDFTMPGSNIYGAALGIVDPMGDGLVNGYAILSGTSMATPHMAGLLACARQLYKQKYNTILTAAMVKDIGAKLGHPKNNDTGFGVLTWTMIKQYADAYL